MHRRADLFPSPDSFLPSRFLDPPSPTSPTSPAPPIPRDAFRPFEKGPRNCIGQELAMMEMKIILLLTIRDFNLDACYDEEVAGQREGRYAHIQGQSAPEELGGRAYQMLKFSPKPNEGMPLRVTVRNQRA
jgi:cytochrome P450